jgi:hypothetical protein
LLHTSYHNAKLLLTAEYLVLNGAKALALPLKFGQRLEVDDNETGFISWKSIAFDGSIWFSAKYDLLNFEIIESINPGMAQHPQRLLRAARKLKHEFLNQSSGCNVVSTLNYPLLWGLGSSSTLITGISAWAGIDPFQLHFEVSSGSGYDIACAISKGPVLYSVSDKIPVYQPVKFSPSFADRIFFVYQGKKQDSAEGIQNYRNRNSDPGRSSVDMATSLTERMILATTLTGFETIMYEHETLISDLLGVPSIKQTLFANLPGEVKSLGAWGGDFCMLTWHDNLQLLPAYLKSKGFEVWFNFNEIVL